MSTKVTDLTALTTTPEDTDELHIVDVSDTTGTAAGTSKRVDVSVLMGKAPVQSVNGDTGTVVLDIEDLNNVTTATPGNGNILNWQTNQWILDTRLTTLYDEFRTGTTTDVQNGAGTQSKLELTATTAKMKTGVTEVKLTETSPGEIDFVVAAGASGSETAFTAVEINGTTTANNALFDVKTGTRLRIESSTNDLATLRNQASADTVIDLPTSTGTLALTSELYTDADADAQIAAASVTDLSDVTSAGSGAIITSAERTKLSGIATGAEVNAVDSVNTQTGAVVLDADDISDASTTNKFTTTSSVTAAGALMDSEVTNLAQVKAFDSSDYATAAQGTTADSALQDVVSDTTPQLGGDLDTNGSYIDMSLNSASTLLVGPNQYAFRLKNGTVFNYGLYFNATASKHEFINATGNTIFSIQANTGELTIGDVTGGTHYILPSADGSANQVLATDGSGNVDFVTLSTSNTNIANTNLTADNNRTLDLDANSLTIDINDGEFTLSNSAESETYIYAIGDLLALGDSTNTVKSNGVFQAELGIEQDEANLTTLGDIGAGCEVTYMGSAATAVSQGRVYYYSGSTWTAYTPASEAPQKALLGIALGSTMSKGFLLKGFMHPDSGTLTAGTQVFGLTNATVGTTAPTTSGHFQRILGHSISTSVIYFNPSHEYIELT